MSSPAQEMSREGERQFLERLRSRYEADGFSFTIEPPRSTLPSFMGSYRPDAVAEKDGRHVAIEVKSRRTRSADVSLQEIRRLFKEQPEWQFSVFYAGLGSLESVTIDRAPPAVIRERIMEVRELANQGHRRPAFVMAWSLLEAVLQSAKFSEGIRPLGPGTVVQTLAEDGYIGAETERRLRSIVDIRNRIVHGDVKIEPTKENVELVLDAAEEALNASET
jgi:uncharacterized protein YutE (UPF0331/DUF86 family)